MMDPSEPKYTLRLDMSEPGKLATDMAKSLREQVERFILDSPRTASAYMPAAFDRTFKVDRYRPIAHGVQSFEKWIKFQSVPAPESPIEEGAHSLAGHWNCHRVTEIQAVTFSLEPVVSGGLPNPPHCVVVWDQLEV